MENTMASKKDFDIIKWFGLTIVVLQLVFGAGIWYSQHQQLIPLVQKIADKQEENRISIAVNSTRIAQNEKEIEKCRKK